MGKLTPPESDSDLLNRYAQTHDEAAFAALVQRRIDGIFSAARRRVGGDIHLAEDVAQLVFVALARSAAALVRHPDLTGWLYTTTRRQAANVVRAERRRKDREQKALVMSENSSSPEVDWARVAPVLDDAIEQLGVPDRTAILLRFVERRAFAEIGATLHVSEDAARMRVDRALDRLRLWLERRGIASSTAALGAVLHSQAAGAAPATLAASVTHAALAGGASAGPLGAVETFFAMTKLKIGIAAVAAIVAGALTLREVRAGLSLSGEVSRLQQEQNTAAGLRAANTRLAAKVADLAPGNSDAAELARVRQRLAQLQQRPEGVTDAAMKPVSAYANRGWATPVAAFETHLWARVNDNADEFAKIYGWTSRGKAKLDRFFAALPSDVRARYGTPERMLALEDARYRPDGQRTVAVQILGQTNYGDKVLVHSWWRLASGQEVDGSMLFQRVDDRWVVPFSDELTERALAALDPVTGRRDSTK